MNYYYSLPRFQRSSSLDRGIYEFGSGKRSNYLTRNLLDNYQITRNRSGRADSVILGNFNRALSVSPANFSSREHTPTHSTYSHRKFRSRSICNGDEVLPTSYLKAHSPPQYVYFSHPYGYDLPRSTYYLDDDTTSYPSYYNRYLSHYYPRTYSSYYYPNSSRNSEIYHPRQRINDSLSRVPESQYYYRYNVLPYYDYNANDILRDRRRKINSRLDYRSDFHAPPFGFFSDMKRNRYTGIDMAPSSTSVGDNILEKSLQMAYRKRY